MTDLVATRRSLHAVAELLLAGPQYAASGTIKLRPTPAGFGTVRTPDTRVVGTDLVGPQGQVSLPGRSVQDVAAAAGLTVRSLGDVYSDGAGLAPEHVLHLDAAAAHEIADAFRSGDVALASLAPDVERVLWPEHFDLGLALDEVNYGVSAGDPSSRSLRLRRAVVARPRQRLVLERAVRRRPPAGGGPRRRRVLRRGSGAGGC